jgi:hypothetical protein
VTVVAGKNVSVELAYTWYLYHQGDLCEDITGGWVKTGTGGSLTFNDESMTLVADGYQKTTLAATVNMVNLSDKSTLYFRVKSSTTYSVGHPRIGVSTANDSAPNFPDRWAATTTLSASESFTTGSVDVSSLTGSYYILVAGLFGDSGKGSIEVQDIWGE